jgi:hypothetical protein
MAAKVNNEEKKKDCEVQSIREVDMSGLHMPAVAIYEHPDDDPEMCVARVFNLDRPTNVIIRKRTVRELMYDIQTNTTMYFMHRGADDVPCLVGVFV